MSYPREVVELKIQVFIYDFPKGVANMFGANPVMFPLEKSATCVPPFDIAIFVFFPGFSYLNLALES